ncbi:MAG: hypothetical protein HYY04_12830 [Chloroflexi bacterium]|nr:hypothetical protein [Chloroflexota bacterium]
MTIDGSITDCSVELGKETRAARLEQVLAELRRRFGEWIIYRLREARPRLGELTISTGSLGLDRATRIAGVPRGRLTEFSGPPTSGKSALAFHVLANAQRQQGFVALIDASHAADFARLQRCGVNLSDLLLVVPESASEAFDITSLLVASEGLDALVISAVNSLVVGPGGDPRSFSQGLRRLLAELAHSPTVVVVLVHVDPLWLRVGRNAARALAHAATLRLAFRPVRLLTHPSGDVQGLRLQVEVVKNKLARPYEVAELAIWRDRGIHVAAELFDLGLAQCLRHDPLGYWFGDTWLGRGRQSAILTLEDDPALALALREALLSKGSSVISDQSSGAPGTNGNRR